MNRSRRQTRLWALLRRSWPWLMGLAILAILATRVPLSGFREAISHGPHLTLAVVNVIINVLVLGSDSIATWVGLAAVGMRRTFLQVLVVRGATYLLLVVNYAIGQGGFGYYLYRTGVAPRRATGATLFLIGTNFAALIVVTAAVWVIRGTGAAGATMWWTLVASCAALAAYLAVIALAPGWLAPREVLVPLFAAGLRGHALAMAGRLPHVVVIVIGQWVALRTWGIAVPFADGVTILPAVVIASVLPISPAGLGTTQAALVWFFSDYAAGATADQRSTAVLAFAIVHFVYGVLASMSVGMVCAPLARREVRRLPTRVDAITAVHDRLRGDHTPAR